LPFWILDRAKKLVNKRGNHSVGTHHSLYKPLMRISIYRALGRHSE
jgi:hypothetical protein